MDLIQILTFSIFYLFHWLVKADSRVWRHTNLHQKRPASFGWAALPDTFLQTRDTIHPSRPLSHFWLGILLSDLLRLQKHSDEYHLIPLHLTNVSIIYPDILFRFFLIARTIYLSLLAQLSLPILPLETFSLVNIKVKSKASTMITSYSGKSPGRIENQGWAEHFPAGRGKDKNPRAAWGGAKVYLWRRSEVKSDTICTHSQMKRFSYSFFLEGIICGRNKKGC